MYSYSAAIMWTTNARMAWWSPSQAKTSNVLIKRTSMIACMQLCWPNSLTYVLPLIPKTGITQTTALHTLFVFFTFSDSRENKWLLNWMAPRISEFHLSPARECNFDLLLGRYSDRLRTERPGFDSRQRQWIFLYSTASRPALGPI
jgi:hypothetical protein